jgi:predicted hydrolase (HD superfamily)
VELTRDRAWALLTEYTRSESLLKHALAVEAPARGYARMFSKDADHRLHHGRVARPPEQERARSRKPRRSSSG